MKVLISPAKTLDFDSPLSNHFEKLTKQFQPPPFPNKTKELIIELKKYSIPKLQDLMAISPKLAKLNHERYQNWESDLDFESRPAIYAFRGDVYEGIDIAHYEISDLKSMEKKVRILSGLYGYLTPLTLMHPYRLEMGTKLATPHGHDLYDFWGDQIAKSLTAEMKRNEWIANLASNEYFKAVQKYLKQEIITPIFKDQVKKEYKIVSFWAKKARGAMTSFIVKNDIQKKEELKNFNWEGYRYQESPSNTPTFYRDH